MPYTTFYELSTMPPQTRDLCYAIFECIRLGGESVDVFEHGTQYAEDEYYETLAAFLYMLVNVADEKHAKGILVSALRGTEALSLFRIIEAVSGDTDIEDDLLVDRAERAYALMSDGEDDPPE